MPHWQVVQDIIDNYDRQKGLRMRASKTPVPVIRTLADMLEGHDLETPIEPEDAFRLITTLLTQLGDDILTSRHASVIEVRRLIFFLIQLENGFAAYQLLYTLHKNQMLNQEVFELLKNHSYKSTSTLVPKLAQHRLLDVNTLKACLEQRDVAHINEAFRRYAHVIDKTTLPYILKSKSPLAMAHIFSILLDKNMLNKANANGVCEVQDPDGFLKVMKRALKYTDTDTTTAKNVSDALNLLLTHKSTLFNATLIETWAKMPPRYITESFWGDIQKMAARPTSDIKKALNEHIIKTTCQSTFRLCLVDYLRDTALDVKDTISESSFNERIEHIRTLSRFNEDLFTTLKERVQEELKMHYASWFDQPDEPTLLQYCLTTDIEQKALENIEAHLTNSRLHAKLPPSNPTPERRPSISGII